MMITPLKWLLNPISKHKYGIYRITDIENSVILTHNFGILISNILNPQTLSNIRVSNTISNQHYGQPIKARDNVQEFVIDLPY